MIAHIYPSVLQALAGRGYAGCLEGVIPGVLRGLIQDPASELPRILIPRTWVNKGSGSLLWTIWSLFGVEKHCRGKEQARMSEQAQRVENENIPQWAQGQGQRHSALHLRADRRSEDSRGRRAIHRLDSVARV